MATYKYTAISKDGVKVSGVVEGFNEFDAVDRIKQDCDIVLKLTEVEEKKPGLLSMEIGGNRLNAKAFSLMCAQFSNQLPGAWRQAASGSFHRDHPRRRGIR